MSPKQKEEIIRAFGHPNIRAIHPTTLMFTRDRQLSKTGDCITAVKADKAVSDLSSDFKDTLRAPNAKLTILIEVNGLKKQIKAFGSPNLILTHPSDMVIRKSSYICDRTIAIHAEFASKDLPRDLVEKLKNPKQEAKITLIVYS